MKIKKRWVLAIVLIAVAAVAYQLFFAKPPEVHQEEGYHAHSDFAVFINGQKINFSKQEYMNDASCGKPLDLIDLSDPANYQFVTHVHDLNGNVIHFHHANATLAMFFKSIGFDLTKDCFETRESQYCATFLSQLRVFANGLEVMDIEKFAPSDLDKILVTYGQESNAEIRAQNEQLTNQACIYSEKCAIPNGFELPEESCSV